LDAGANFQSYLWSDNVSTTETIDVTQTGSYTVSTVDLNGCPATSTSFNVTVIPLPVVTIFANGSTNICAGSTITLSMPVGYSSYLWSPGGQITNSIFVSTAGDYTGSATNSAGCSNNTPTIHVTVNPQPEPVIIPQGPIELCYGETITLDAGNEGYVSYSWFNNQVPINVHTQLATVGVSGNYTVTVLDTNGCGQGVISPPTHVTVFPELIPFITISGNHDTLFSSAAQSYQWFLNGDSIPGASNQYYVPGESGNYTVAVTDGNGCAGTSENLEFTYIGIETVGGNFTSLNLYPNPGKGRFTITADFVGVSSVNITITDMLGNEIMPAINIKGVSSLKQDISVEEFANGIYFVRVMADNNQKVIRYIKD
jgi:hypothetical protein